VFTPTQTGLGERKHLLSKDITLGTFTTDIVNVIEAEELNGIVLVGHSFGGNAISGVADVMPERIRHLVYLDSLVVEGGKAPFDNLAAEVVAARRKAAEESSGGLSLPNPPPAVFGVLDPADAEWVRRRLTPHPISTYTSKLNIRGPVGNHLRAYLRPLHQPVLRCAASLARLDQGASRLALGRDRHRPRCHGDGAGGTCRSVDRRFELSIARLLTASRHETPGS
jgi:pimeloyl-ACP methyl ester carboxylesterase